jgi:phosphoribosyl 1,2-cyclic phosphate phosphodiesterase
MATHPTNLRLILLGTGTSGGIPLIGCHCDTCRSDDPRDKRTRSGAALLFDDPTGRPRCILIDCTPDLRVQSLRHRLERCDAILFTHHHVDHIFGLDEVRRFNAVMNAGIDVLADRHTMDSLHRVYQHIFDREANVNQSFVAALFPRIIEPFKPISLLGLRFTPLRLLHGKLPILGFRIEFDSDHAAPTSVDSESSHPLLPLAYCTDVSAIPTETWPWLGGLSTLIIDGLRHRHHPTHMTVRQATQVAERCQPVRTYLTHIAHEIRHADVDPELPQSVSLGYDGLTLGHGEPGEGPGVTLDWRWMGTPQSRRDEHE